MQYIALTFSFFPKASSNAGIVSFVPFSIFARKEACLFSQSNSMAGFISSLMSMESLMA